MNAMVKVVMWCLVVVGASAQVAEAAVTCVENKVTGKFEERAGKKPVTGDCEAHSTLNMLSTIPEAEGMTLPGETKIIDGVIVTNASKPFTIKVKAEEEDLQADDALMAAHKGVGNKDAAKNDVTARVSFVGAAKPAVVSRQVVGLDITAQQPAPPRVFVARVGSSLRKSVAEWAASEGWKLDWKADDLDYDIVGELTFEGSFQSAVMQIFKLYEKAERSMLVDGNSRQKLLVVIEK